MNNNNKIVQVFKIKQTVVKKKNKKSRRKMDQNDKITESKGCCQDTQPSNSNSDSSNPSNLTELDQQNSEQVNKSSSNVKQQDEQSTQNEHKNSNVDPDLRFQDATEGEKLVGVTVKEIMTLFKDAQSHFRLFPELTDEQCRHYICSRCPFRFTQIEMYKILTRRSTGQEQLKGILDQHEKAMKQLLQK